MDGLISVVMGVVAFIAAWRFDHVCHRLTQDIHAELRRLSRTIGEDAPEDDTPPAAPTTNLPVARIHRR